MLDLKARLERLVAATRKEGRESALADVRSLVGGDGGEILIPVRRGPGRPKGSKNRAKAPAAPMPRKKRRNP